MAVGTNQFSNRNCILFSHSLKHGAKMFYSFSVGLNNFLLTVSVNPLIWFVSVSVKRQNDERLPPRLC